MITVISFVILLSVIVVVHEFGHLMAAKLFKVYCHEFSIGMGKKLFSKKFGETEYSIRLLPIGGFVAMAGDTDNALETSVDVVVPENRTLKGIAKWKKIIIMFAGALLNFVLAWVIITGVLMYNGAYALPRAAIVGGVSEGSSAELAGFETGDIIEKIEFEDGRIIYPETYDDILVFTQSNQDELIYTVNRNGLSISIPVTPKLNEKEGVYQVGIMLPEAEIVETNLFNSMGYSIDFMVQSTKSIFVSLGQLITGKGLENLSGPVGIYQATDAAVSMGLQSFILMIAMLSLNVGIFNLLPLPILDGGRIILTCVEAIIRKPISQKIEMAIMTGSMILLLGLVVLTTFQDLLRLF